MRRILRTLLIATTALFPFGALAQSPGGAPIESTVEFGDARHDYELHYSLVPSTFLANETAAALGITRANNRMLINLSLREKLADGSTREQTAQLRGSYTDLIQKKPFEFREVRESGAIYYLAEFRHGDRETLRFDISATAPDGASKSFTFTRTLYVDP